MTKTLSFAAAMNYTPRNPERTARKSGTGMNFDVTFREWPNRASMLKTLELQGRRERRSGDWTECRSIYVPGSMQLSEVSK